MLSMHDTINVRKYFPGDRETILDLENIDGDFAVDVSTLGKAGSARKGLCAAGEDGSIGTG